MKVDAVEKFISKFVQHERKSGNPSAGKIPDILRNLVYKVLPERDRTVEFVIRDAIYPKSLSFSHEEDGLWVWPRDEKINIAIERPYWRKGLSQYIHNEHLNDSISWFFHFASQYVERSRRLDVLAAIALVYDLPFRFFGSTYFEYILSDDDISSKSDIRKEHGIKNSLIKNYNAKERCVINFLNSINCLDPYIHRLMFNYIRHLELENNAFIEESITALDKTISVAKQYLISRDNSLSGSTREEMMMSIGIDSEDVKTLEWLYELRSYFGAHPSMSKWWDFGEILDSDYEMLIDAVKNVIFRIIRLEERERRVEKNPETWSDWFCEHAPDLWDAVWFDKFPERA